MDGQLVSLRVRPSVAADLAFDASGILRSRNTGLAWPGKAVTSFDVFTQVVQHLGEAQVDASNAPTGRLVYDAAKITAVMAPVALATLRNDALAAALDQAMLRRQNRFLLQYRLAAQMAAAVQGNVQAKLQALQLLQQLTTTQFQQLDAAYKSNGKDQVLEPAVETTVTATSKTTDTALVAAVGARQVTHSIKTTTNNVIESQVVDDVDSVPLVLSATNKWEAVTAATVGTANKTGTQETMASSTQKTSPAAEDWRHLALENRIRQQRTQADLGDELASATVASLQVGSLLQVWQNELADLDCDIRRLQLAFMNTFLVSPVGGTVTAVYKDAGEGVDAREAVVRVEQSTGAVFLVGQIRCHGLVSLGANVRLSTQDLFGAPGTPFAMAGSIVAIKGHDAENDVYNLVIQAQNKDASGSNLTLPLGYSFDRDTKITF